MLHRLKKLIPEQHPVRLVWHKSKALAAAVRYGFPAKKLTVIGVTGTDGKTTTVGMIAHILNANDIPTGALSTAFFQIKKDITWNATQKTSPSPFIIQKFLRQLINEGCTHAVLEYSSHGLVQGRTLFTYPLIGGITNVSAEHLDYHGTMQEYIRAKGLLFHMLQKKGGCKVINGNDDTYSIYNKIPTEWTIGYTTNGSFGEGEQDDKSLGIWTGSIHTSPKGSAADLFCTGVSNLQPLTLTVPGSFNMDNALCAISCAHAAGVDLDECTRALKSFTGIPGRMERIDAGQDFSVFIDFTVTPQSYEATLSTLKAMLPADKRLLVLMGSCGDRMKEKRPVIGKIASGYADVLVVTNEDPYTEDPEKIIDDVWAGVDQTKTKAHRMSDRKEAIEFLLKEAKKDDIVILCGKGSDTTMWVKGGQIPWNEREIVKTMLGTLRA